MMQSLTDQVSALQAECVLSERVPPDRATSERQPPAVRQVSATPPTRSTTVLPTTEPQLDSLRAPSIARSGITNATYGPQFYKTRDVQTLSDGIDPTYEAWSIQLEGKFLEP